MQILMLARDTEVQCTIGGGEGTSKAHGRHCACSEAALHESHNTVYPEIFAGIKFGGWAQNRQCKNIIADLNFAVR